MHLFLTNLLECHVHKMCWDKLPCYLGKRFNFLMDRHAVCSSGLICLVVQLLLIPLIHLLLYFFFCLPAFGKTRCFLFLFFMLLPTKDAKKNVQGIDSISSACPTDNALLVNFWLSSDAEMLLIITNWACKKHACNVYCTYSNWASILHSIVGGWVWNSLCTFFSCLLLLSL